MAFASLTTSIESRFSVQMIAIMPTAKGLSSCVSSVESRGDPMLSTHSRRYSSASGTSRACLA